MSNLPNLDASLTITGIIAVAAIISPILVALINNHHQLKLKNAETDRIAYEENEKAIKQVYINYIKYTGRCLACALPENEEAYNEYYFQLLMYVPEEIANSMKKINDLILGSEYIKASKELEDLVPKLKVQIRKL